MSNELIRKTLNRELPVLDLLNIKYIDKTNSFISPKGDDWLRDGIVYFKINVDKEKFKEQLRVISENIMVNYLDEFENTTNHNDEYYIMYEPYNKLALGMEDKNKGGITAFAIKHNGKIYRELGGIIGSTLMYMKALKHTQIETVKNKINEFAGECYKWINEQIRRVIEESNVKGEFCMDDIQMDTYMQRRSSGEKIYDYIAHDWHRLFAKNPIVWIDFMNEDKVYVALGNEDVK